MKKINQFMKVVLVLGFAFLVMVGCSSGISKLSGFVEMVGPTMELLENGLKMNGAVVTRTEQGMFADGDASNKDWTTVTFQETTQFEVTISKNHGQDTTTTTGTATDIYIGDHLFVQGNIENGVLIADYIEITIFE